MSTERQDPLHEGVFCVGDAAGQCLPMTAEGIRSAIFCGVHCGQALAAALAGHSTVDEAQGRYRVAVQQLACYHDRLRVIQGAIAWAPEWLRAAAGQIAARRPVTHYLMDHYLGHTGGIAAVPAAIPGPRPRRVALRRRGEPA